MPCRPACGACCIAPSISSPIPGMPLGKPANTPCIHLDDQYRCGLFGQPERPAVCSDFKPCIDVCGTHREEALELIRWLEDNT